MAITNGGFETGDLTGWTSDISGDASAVVDVLMFTQFDDLVPYAGTYLLTITKNSFNPLASRRETVYQNVAVTAGQSIAGKACYRYSGNINDGAEVTIWLGGTLIATPYTQHNNSPGYNVWESWTWEAPTSDTYQVRLSVFNEENSAFTAMGSFDAVTIVDPPPPTDPPGLGIAIAEGQGWWTGVGIGFRSEANRALITGVGGSFKSIAAGTMDYGNVGDGVGYGFSSTVAGLGGATGIGSGFSSTVAGIMDTPEYWYGKGYGFNSTAAGVLNVTVLMSGKGAGFSSKATGLGGAVGAGNGFTSTVAGVMQTSELMQGKGGSFYSTASGVVVVPAFAYGKGGGFSSTVWHATGQGGSFSSTVSGKFLSTLINSEAFVMNMTPNSAGQYPVTRFTNYPFNNIVKLGSNYYGVKDDGFYLLSGDLDITTAVNGTITLKDTDFGVYQEKRLQYVYLNTDTVTTTVPFVNGVQKPGVASLFNGRRCKLPLGDRGRYWQLRIENIKKLEGVEFNPVGVQRKV